MNTTLFLFSFFSSFSLLTSFLVISAKNPIYSVFFLVLTFFNVSCLLILLELEFLSISLIVIYVGAIAVLFLFVLMMLNIKLSNLKESTVQYLPAGLFFCVVFVLEILVIFQSEISPLILSKNSEIMLLFEITEFVNTTFISSWITLLANAKSLGVILFTQHFYHFLVSSYVLLLAMVSAIILTLQKRFIAKSQNIYKQVLRDFNSTVVINT